MSCLPFCPSFIPYKKFIRHLSRFPKRCETKPFALAMQKQKPRFHFAPCYISEAEASEFAGMPAYLIPYRTQRIADLYSNAVLLIFISGQNLHSLLPDATVKPYVSTNLSARLCRMTLFTPGIVLPEKPYLTVFPSFPCSVHFLQRLFSCLLHIRNFYT